MTYLEHICFLKHTINIQIDAQISNKTWTDAIKSKGRQKEKKKDDVLNRIHDTKVRARASYSNLTTLRHAQKIMTKLKKQMSKATKTRRQTSRATKIQITFNWETNPLVVESIGLFDNSSRPFLFELKIKTLESSWIKKYFFSYPIIFIFKKIPYFFSFLVAFIISLAEGNTSLKENLNSFVSSPVDTTHRAQTKMRQSRRGGGGPSTAPFLSFQENLSGRLLKMWNEPLTRNRSGEKLWIKKTKKRERCFSFTE